MNVRVRSALIIFVIVALDRISKLYIRSHVSLSDMFPVIPDIFNIVHAENPGAAFSMLTDAPPYWRFTLLVGVSLSVLLVIGVLLWRLPKNAGGLMSIALATVFGGALGNLWDRIFRGTVTDFLQVFIGSYEFPSFNVADSAITVGAALLVIDLWRTRKTA
jgi:signal peptidase II